MIANYHTHTPRCRHARGSEEEYIQAAIEAGMEALGFSDHTPQPFENGYYSKMRMYPEQLEEYMQTLRQLQSKYAHQLKIHIGLETEYYPACFPKLMEWVRQAGVEYMILGQHWLGNEEGERHIFHAFEEPERLVRYCDQAIEAMHTGVFSYFAHPDIANFVGDRDFYDKQMIRLIREAKACHLPLEYNLHGARCGCSYPDPHFWELVAAEGNPVILGRDAHDVFELKDEETEAKGLEVLKRVGITPIARLELKKP